MTTMVLGVAAFSSGKIESDSVIYLQRVSAFPWPYNVDPEQHVMVVEPNHWAPGVFQKVV